MQQHLAYAVADVGKNCASEERGVLLRGVIVLHLVTFGTSIQVTCGIMCQPSFFTCTVFTDRHGSRLKPRTVVVVVSEIRLPQRRFYPVQDAAH